MIFLVQLFILVPSFFVSQETELEIRKKQVEIATFLKTAKADREFRAAIVELTTLAEKAATLRKYELAAKLYLETERVSRGALLDPVLARVHQEAAKRMNEIGKEWQRASKAAERILDKEGTPEDYLATGKFYCFVAGNWTLGLDDLSKGKDPVLQKLAQMDLAGAKEADGMFAIGDAWASRKEPGAKDRAVHWYGQAWPLLSGIAREKRRTLFRAAYIKGPSKKRAAEAAMESASKGQYYFDDGVTHDGKWSLQLIPGPVLTNGRIQLKRPLVAGQTYRISAWCLSDEATVTNCSFFVSYIVDGVVGQPHIFAKAATDQPWWSKSETTFTLPANAKVELVAVDPGTGKGVVWMDDISIKSEDGAELVEDPGFEK